jgi:hypothetical protein
VFAGFARVAFRGKTGLLALLAGDAIGLRLLPVSSEIPEKMGCLPEMRRWIG